MTCIKLSHFEVVKIAVVGVVGIEKHTTIHVFVCFQIKGIFSRFLQNIHDFLMFYTLIYYIYYD